MAKDDRSECDRCGNPTGGLCSACRQQGMDDTSVLDATSPSVVMAAFTLVLGAVAVAILAIVWGIV